MFTTPITPRVCETDGARHINNTVVPAWLESGRVEIFRMFTPDLSFDDWRVALVNTNIDYLAQIFWQHPAEVRTWVDHVGNTSFRLYEELWQRNTLCVRATVTYVQFDYEAQRPVAIPDAIRRRLCEHLRGG